MRPGFEICRDMVASFELQAEKAREAASKGVQSDGSLQMMREMAEERLLLLSFLRALIDQKAVNTQGTLMIAAFVQSLPQRREWRPPS